MATACSSSPEKTSPSEGSHCPWPGCDTIFNAKRNQDRDRHVLARHLPLLLVCMSCNQRSARLDSLKHFENCNQGNEAEVCSLYSKKLVLGWVFEDGTPVETVVKYALDFVVEWALKRGNQAVLNDPCGRRGTRSTDQCRCVEGYGVSTVAALENATETIDSNISPPPSTLDISTSLETPVPSGQLPINACQDFASLSSYIYVDPCVSSSTLFDEGDFYANFQS